MYFDLLLSNRAVSSVQNRACSSSISSLFGCSFLTNSIGAPTVKEYEVPNFQQMQIYNSLALTDSSNGPSLWDPSKRVLKESSTHKHDWWYARQLLHKFLESSDNRTGLTLCLTENVHFVEWDYRYNRCSCLKCYLHESLAALQHNSIVLRSCVKCLLGPTDDNHNTVWRVAVFRLFIRSGQKHSDAVRWSRCHA